MLTRLKPGNFKSWHELDIELAPLTLLFGTNSSGKSAIIKALLMLKQTVESHDLDQQINNYPPNFFGDILADLDAMTDAAIARRREELQAVD